jgi:hypothetical protein
MAENSGAERKKPRGRGRPFQKGQSGNPGGRPKEIAELREMARAHSAEAIETLVTTMRDAKDPRVQVAAAVALLDRGWGRPGQEITGADGEGFIGGGVVILPPESD